MVDGTAVANVMRHTVTALVGLEADGLPAAQVRVHVCQGRHSEALTQALTHGLGPLV